MFDYLSGLALGLSLIVAIGAQNAFVIRQGLRGEHVFPVSLTCALSDAILITVGVAGIGWLTVENAWLVSYATLFGGAFLVFLGVYHLKSALSTNEGLSISGSASKTLREALFICLALTWLNPHVYVETVFLIGSVASAYDQPWVFGAGAVSASFFFFFFLGYASKSLSKYLAKRGTWRVIDAVMAAIMFSIAYHLISPWFQA